MFATGLPWTPLHVPTNVQACTFCFCFVVVLFWFILGQIKKSICFSSPPSPVFQDFEIFLFLFHNFVSETVVMEITIKNAWLSFLSTLVKLVVVQKSTKIIRALNFTQKWIEDLENNN